MQYRQISVDAGARGRDGGEGGLVAAERDNSPGALTLDGLHLSRATGGRGYPWPASPFYPSRGGCLVSLGMAKDYASGVS